MRYKGWSAFTHVSLSKLVRLHPYPLSNPYVLTKCTSAWCITDFVDEKHKSIFFHDFFRILFKRSIFPMIIKTIRFFFATLY